MFIYGKTASNAIAVMSYLAAMAPQRVRSAVIAKERDISPVFTAKLLTQLAGAGLVSGQPGPGGGYTLAKPPAAIRLLDVVTLFEQIDERSRCPYGAHWCGNGAPCPLHDTITDMVDRNRSYLQETLLSVFQAPVPVPKPPLKSRKLPARPPAAVTQRRRRGNPSNPP